MATMQDRWGEPIHPSSRTFSLASMLRVVTAICLGLGWCSVVRFNPHAAGYVLVAIAFVLTAVVAWRQPGGAGTKLTLVIAHFTGVVFVGIYTASVSVSLYPPVSMGDQSDGLMQLAGTALSILFLPLVAIVFAGLLKTWLHLAADGIDRAN